MNNNSTYNQKLRIREIDNIPGMLEIDLAVFEDPRGWFKENWQKEKIEQLGLHNFQPVQNNVSFNAEKGVTRGIHAEPWNKFITVNYGRVFGAWVDLREGENFGNVYYTEFGVDKAIFVPKGVANSFQVLEENTVYSYLVDAHWSPDAKYTMLNLSDKTVAIPWPISLKDAITSEKDAQHPMLDQVIPVKNDNPKKIMIIGSKGQLGSELCLEFPDAIAVDYPEFDITNDEYFKHYDWSNIDIIINAAAMTAVDEAETPEGRKKAWAINVSGVKNLVKLAKKHGIMLIHVSSDYVFDGETANHDENEEFSPLGVYGQTKAAGDAIVSTLERYYILRTSWVIGNGKNFVRTMVDLAKKDIEPNVVDDQFGRLTFVSELVRAVIFLLKNTPEYGTYNVTNSGEVLSWADYAKLIYDIALGNGSASMVTGVSTDEYTACKENISPRPTHSDLDLTKIKNIGFKSQDYAPILRDYIKKM